MAVNWGILETPDVGNAFMKGFDYGRKLRQENQRQKALDAYVTNKADPDARNALMANDPGAAMKLFDYEREQGQYDTQARVGGMAAAGDIEGAQTEALRSGDFDLAGAVGQMTSDQRKAAMEENARFGEAIKWADTPEKWDQAVDYFASNGIAGAEKYRGRFDQREALALEIGQIGSLIQEAEKGVVMAPGSRLVDPRTGRLLAEAPDRPDYRTVGEGQTLVQVGGGAPAASGSTGAQIEQTALAAVPGAIVTSRQRSAGHNAKVGGVKNSYHLTDQARDFVPPAGMSMGQLAASLKQSMPGFDVINEGDHVHVEPGSRGGAQVIARGNPKPVKADPEVKANRKAEGDLRKEFNNLPEVKDFKDVRANFQQIKTLAKPNATAQDDMALIFSFMKMLDPGSVVREGEFANAQNTAGVPDQIRNAYNKALNGTRLNANQRRQMAQSAAQIYTKRRETYNAKAEEYRSYAGDYGVSADRVARRYIPDRRAQASGGWGKAKVVNN